MIRARVRHIPETACTACQSAPASSSRTRTTPNDLTEFQVRSVQNGKASLVPKGVEEPETTVDVEDLLVVKRFHERIHPGLMQVGGARHAPEDKPTHISRRYGD